MSGSKGRPSPALLVAIVALLAAVGGTALAGPSLHHAKKKKHKKQAGDKIIKKRSLSGNRLKAKTVTGAEVDLSKLGTVPSAAHAADASHAGNADKVGGKGPGAFEPAGTTVSSGLVGIDIGPAGLDGFGPSKDILHKGPFTLRLRCQDGGGGSSVLRIQLLTTVGETRGRVDTGSVAAVSSPGSPGTIVNQSGSSAYFVLASPWTAIGGNGAVVSGVLNYGGFLYGHDCWASATAS